MGGQRISGLSGLFDGRLPINRKERYYTGTVLPMIVACDGFKHLNRFLELCGAPSKVAVEADPASCNIEFFTEYSLKESLRGGAEKRFSDPAGKDTPDLVIYIESDTSLCCSALKPSSSSELQPTSSKGNYENKLTCYVSCLKG